MEERFEIHNINGDLLKDCIVNITLPEVNNDIKSFLPVIAATGNPLAMAVGNAVLDILLEDGFFDQVSSVGNYLKQQLHHLVERYDNIFTEVRGVGLMLGLQCLKEGQNNDLVKAAIKEGLLTVPAGDNVVRLVPPLIIENNDVDKAVTMIDAACASLKSSSY